MGVFRYVRGFHHRTFGKTIKHTRHCVETKQSVHHLWRFARLPRDARNDEPLTSAGRFFEAGLGFFVLIWVNRSRDFGFPPVPFEELINALKRNVSTHKFIEIMVQLIEADFACVFFESNDFDVRAGQESRVSNKQ